MPPRALGTAVIVAGLVLAAGGLVPVIRNRSVGILLWIGLGVVELLVLAEVVAAGWHLARGEHPRQTLTFIGYVLAFLVILPLAAVLARMEPTRWGAVIVTVAALVVSVLVLRIDQLWAGNA